MPRNLRVGNEDWRDHEPTEHWEREKKAPRRGSGVHMHLITMPRPNNAWHLDLAWAQEAILGFPDVDDHWGRLLTREARITELEEVSNL